MTYRPADDDRLLVVDHPVVAHLLAEARERKTPHSDFRLLLEQLGQLLAYEATRDLPTAVRTVHTPLEQADAAQLRDPVTIVGILRAGLGLMSGMLGLVPEARVGHLGMFRDEQALQPVHYYENLPEAIDRGVVLLVDPMLATGGSALAALEMLHRKGAKDIRLVCLVAAPEGLEKLRGSYPDLPIVTAVVDRELDDRGYILPGLGDAGDRLYGTSD